MLLLDNAFPVVTFLSVFVAWIRNEPLFDPQAPRNWRVFPPSRVLTPAGRVYLRWLYGLFGLWILLFLFRLAT